VGRGTAEYGGGPHVGQAGVHCGHMLCPEANRRCFFPEEGRLAEGLGGRFAAIRAL